MVRADEALRVFHIGRLAAGAGGEIEQRQIDDAVAHIDGRADIEVLAVDAFEIKDGLVEFRGLVEVVHANGEVAQAGHEKSSTGLKLPCSWP
jgi:hypothetical protein